MITYIFDLKKQKEVEEKFLGTYNSVIKRRNDAFNSGEYVLADNLTEELDELWRVIHRNTFIDYSLEREDALLSTMGIDPIYLLDNFVDKGGLVPQDKKKELYTLIKTACVPDPILLPGNNREEQENLYEVLFSKKQVLLDIIKETHNTKAPLAILVT